MNDLLKVFLLNAIVGLVISYIAMVISKGGFNFKFDFWMSIVISEGITGIIVYYLLKKKIV